MAQEPHPWSATKAEGLRYPKVNSRNDLRCIVHYTWVNTLGGRCTNKRPMIRVYVYMYRVKARFLHRCYQAYSSVGTSPNGHQYTQAPPYEAIAPIH